MRMSDWSSDVCSSDLVGGDFSVVDGDVEVLADQDALAGKVEVAHSLDGHGVVARERKSGARGRSSAVRFAEGPGGTSLSGYPQRQANRYRQGAPCHLPAAIGQPATLLLRSGRR